MKKMFITGGLAVVLASLVLAAGALAETPAKTLRAGCQTGGTSAYYPG